MATGAFCTGALALVFAADFLTMAVFFFAAPDRAVGLPLAGFVVVFLPLAAEALAGRDFFFATGFDLEAGFPFIFAFVLAMEFSRL
ncbi:MAG: hypothetical protein IPP33_15085 [Flavobacteriales bacterium]|nr:hypothetical protein [Flavobacteriales bacterium]